MPILQESVLRILNKNRQKNAFLIRTLEREPDTKAYLYGGSAAVFERRTRSWLFSPEREGDFTALLKMHKRPIGTFYVNSSDFEEEIRTALPDARIQRYVQYNITAEGFADDPGAVNPEIRVVPVDKSWIDFILSLYKSEEFGHRAYIRACIEENPGFGALLDGERAGYILIHRNGEIGSMTVSEKYRGRGVGSTLMQRMTPVYAAQASIGCGFVLPENTRSRQMMERSCFVPLDKTILWVYRREIGGGLRK